MQKYYKYQYRFNATHSFDYNKENAHMHTFTVGVYLSGTDSENQLMFFDIDRIVNTFLDEYRYCYLNDRPEFRDRLPNIENMGDIFFEELSNRLQQSGVVLHQLDIYENPLSIYQISDRLHIPMCYTR